MPDLGVVSNIEWDAVSVTLDGRVLNDSNEEMDVDDIEAAFASIIQRLRAMLAAANGENKS